MTMHERESLHARMNQLLRDPAAVISGLGSAEIDPRLLACQVQGQWWETLDELGVTLLFSREYEHLLLGMCPEPTGGLMTFMPMPHPSGIAVDRANQTVYVAATRNPNQVFELRPAQALTGRLDSPPVAFAGELLPVRSHYYPGCLYLHDLAIIQNELYANAVGQNCIIKLARDGHTPAAWWPACIDTDKGPILGQNQIQLNSIAAGPSLETSYFTASTDEITPARPGDLNFPVDGRGVVFSAATRQPVARGLTRPHSARLHFDKIWVCNSGYGEFGFIDNGRFETVAKLSGWTRGLCLVGQTAIVGTSRVIPRFRAYAPGLDIEKSICGLHAIDLNTGRIKASVTWEWGNQIFAIDWLPKSVSSGFPWIVSSEKSNHVEKMFYAYCNRS